MVSEEEFQNRIKEIDEELQIENVPISSRPLQAIGRYDKKYRMNIMIAGGDYFKTKNKYDSTNLADAINDWYKNKYGDKLKKDFSLGQIALLIVGDVYKLKIPLIFGALLIYAGDKYKPVDRISERSLPLINVFIYIENITKEIENELTMDESKYILSIFNNAVELFNIIDREKKIEPLIAAAKIDFDNAVNNLLSSHISTGQSKWSSLQATEKVFKAVLTKKGIKFNKIHDLKILASQVCDIGFGRIDDDIINTIQCTADVRYGNENYSIENAIKAHHYSILLCKDLIKFCA